MAGRSQKITRDDIAEFLRLHSGRVNDDQLDAIIRRCDTDDDQALSYSEFIEQVQGESYIAAY